MVVCLYSVGVEEMSTCVKHAWSYAKLPKEDTHSSGPLDLHEIHSRQMMREQHAGRRFEA